MKSTLLSVSLAAIVLSGCGSDNDPLPITEDTVELNEYGVIRLIHDTSLAQTQADAVFCGLNTPVSAGSIDDLFLTSADSCVVSNDGAAQIGAIGALSCGEVLPAQTISAGANLLLSSAAGSYADLSQQLSGDLVTYSAGTSLPRPPNGLTLDIPGDTFPSFSAIEIPDLQDLVVSSPAIGEALQSDTAIRWTAATNRSTSRVLLSASDADVTVTCSLADDGQFNFSSATRAELGELFAAGNVSIRRQNVVSPTRGDSGLVIITSIE